MKIQTFSILAGSRVCNAKCPYCVSKMTPCQGVEFKKQKVNWRNFELSNRFARDNGVSTVLITGKGEPVLYPDQITEYMNHLSKYNYPFIELQTNGIPIAQNYEKYKSYLNKWYELGMTTICISVAHYFSEDNRKIFLPHEKEYIGLPDLIRKLHFHGFSVRLSCVMFKKGIDSPKKVRELLEFAKIHKVEQLSIRPVTKPKDSENQEVADWVEKHELDKKDIAKIRKYLDKNGSVIMQLCHDAIVYDLNGQNICLTNALTIEPESNEIRQLIFFPDGHLRYDWQYKGAILI